MFRRHHVPTGLLILLGIGLLATAAVLALRGDDSNDGTRSATASTSSPTVHDTEAESPAGDQGADERGETVTVIDGVDTDDNGPGDDPEGDGIELPVLDEPPSAAERVDFYSDTPHNEAGRVLVLDELASLACSDVEVALAVLDSDPERARERLDTAAERAAATTTPGFATHAATLAGLDVDDVRADASALFALLETCTAGGHEL